MGQRPEVKKWPEGGLTAESTEGTEEEAGVGGLGLGVGSRRVQARLAKAARPGIEVTLVSPDEQEEVLIIVVIAIVLVVRVLQAGAEGPAHDPGQAVMIPMRVDPTRTGAHAVGPARIVHGLSGTTAVRDAEPRDQEEEYVKSRHTFVLG
jgi:hypothetical protein